MSERKKKVIFFDCVVHFGGSLQVTVLAMNEMQSYCDLLVLDAYGVCREYHDALRKYSIESVVVQPNPKKTIIAGSNPFDRMLRVLSSSMEMLDFIKRLRSAIKKISPDVIWTTSYKALFFLYRAVGQKIPIVYYTHRANTYPRWYNRLDWKKIPLVAGVSSACFFGLTGSPYEPMRSEIVYNGINVAEIVRAGTQEPEVLLSGSGLRILLAGYLNENKNQDTAIRGLAEYIKTGGKATLWLAGDYTDGVNDDYAKSLPMIATELGVADHVHFLGWRNDLPAITSRCDISVLTSLSESFGMVLLEAMCFKKPIIATRVGGIPEVVRDGIDGILIDVCDSSAFAKALERLSDPCLRKEMGESGFQRVQSEFNIKKTASRFWAFINEIC